MVLPRASAVRALTRITASSQKNGENRGGRTRTRGVLAGETLFRTHTCKTPARQSAATLVKISCSLRNLLPLLARLLLRLRGSIAATAALLTTPACARQAQALALRGGSLEGGAASRALLLPPAISLFPFRGTF